MLKVLTSLGSSSCETYLKQSYWLEKSLGFTCCNEADLETTRSTAGAHRWRRLRWTASSHWHPPLHRKPCSQQAPPCPRLLEARDELAAGKGPLEVKPLLQNDPDEVLASAVSHVFAPLKTRWARDLPSWKQRAGSLQNLCTRWIKQVPITVERTAQRGAVVCSSLMGEGDPQKPRPGAWRTMPFWKFPYYLLLVHFNGLKTSPLLSLILQIMNLLQLTH